MEDSQQFGQVLIVRSGSRLLGLLVDRVGRLTRSEAATYHPVPSAIYRASCGLFDAVIETENEPVLVLSLPNLFSQGEERPEDDTDSGSESSLSQVQELSGGSGDRRAAVLVFQTFPDRPDETPLRFGVSLAQVSEVSEPLHVTHVPGLPRSIAGLTNWRGRPVVVADVPAVLGLNDRESPKARRHLIARGRRADSLLVFPLSEPPELLSFPVASEPCSHDVGIDEGFVRGVVSVGDRTLVMLDFEGMERYLGTPNQFDMDLLVDGNLSSQESWVS